MRKRLPMARWAAHLLLAGTGSMSKILTARKKTKNAYRRIDDEDDDLGLIIRFDRLSWLV